MSAYLNGEGVQEFLTKPYYTFNNSLKQVNEKQ
jgi:hypothetical protein